MNPIVIVGGGIIGTSIAYHLRESNRPVVLLERNEGLGSETTRASIGMLGWSYPAPRRLLQYSAERYRELIDDGRISHTPIGTLYTERSKGGVESLRDIGTAVRDLGVESRLVDTDEMGEMGILRPDGRTGLYIPREGYVDTGEVVDFYADTAAGHGVELQTGVELEDITVQNGSVATVVTSGETIAVETVINAAGPWAPRINDIVGISVPLRHNEAPILVLESDQGVDLPNTLLDDGVYFREHGDSRAFAGRKGKPFADASRRDPDRREPVPESFHREVESRIAQSVPVLEAADVVDEWMGYRTITPDGDPILGESRVDGFVLACGLNGTGITLSPGVGWLISGHVGETGRSIRDVSPDRFVSDSGT